MLQHFPWLGPVEYSTFCFKLSWKKKKNTQSHHSFFSDRSLFCNCICSEMEEGSLITSSLISKSGASITSYDSNEQLQNDEQYSSDPVTLTVIFSSLVAVCGSYVYGHAVSVFKYIYLYIYRYQSPMLKHFDFKGFN